MSLSNNTQQSDREKAMEWWNGLTDPRKCTLYYAFVVSNFTPAKGPSQLTGIEIEKLWKETQSLPIDTGEGELQCTPGEWSISPYKSSLIGTRFDNSIETTFIAEIFGNTEMTKANANLITASKDMYKALLNMVKAHSESGEYSVLQKRVILNDSINALTKANKNYKQ